MKPRARRAVESAAPMGTRCKASALPRRLGSLRLPHSPQPRRRNRLQTINQGVGPFYVVKASRLRRRTARPDGGARREANVREKAASQTRFSFQNCPGARYFAILRLKLEHSDTF